PLSVSSAHAAASAIYPKLQYDTLKDLAGITQTASSKYVLVAAPGLGLRSVRELLAAAKARPGEITFSSAGVGSGTHFAAEIFKAMAAIDVVHVPHKGIPEALGETVAGRVQFFMAPIANAVNLVRDGRLVGLGVSSRARDALLPELPTIDEAGVAGYEQELWFGLRCRGRRGRHHERLFGLRNPRRQREPFALDVDAHHRGRKLIAPGSRQPRCRRRAFDPGRAGDWRDVLWIGLRRLALRRNAA